MNSKAPAESPFTYERPWKIDHAFREVQKSSELNMIMQDKNKKRNKENLADRFIPSKISS